MDFIVNKINNSYLHNLFLLIRLYLLLIFYK